MICIGNSFYTRVRNNECNTHYLPLSSLQLEKATSTTEKVYEISFFPLCIFFKSKKATAKVLNDVQHFQDFPK